MVQGMGLRRIGHTVELRGHAGDARHDPQGAAFGDGAGVREFLIVDC